MPKPADGSCLQLTASWRTNAEAWTNAVRSGAIESRRVGTDQAIVNAILEYRPQRLLDLGCGEGWLGRALAAHGIEAVGVDAAGPLIEAARNAAANAEFHLLSYAEIAAAPQRLGTGFDAAVANFALLDETPGPLLKALRHIIKPNGRFLLHTLHPWTVGPPYCDGWRTEDFRSFGTGWQPMPWYFRTLGSWIELLHRAGYALEEVREPLHPDNNMPLSLLLCCSNSGPDADSISQA